MSIATKPAHRKISLAAGIAYVLTFVSIPTFALYKSVKGANYVIGSGPDSAAVVGGLLEITVALAGIATAVILFPMLKRQSETFALGLVAARILESGTIFVGVAFLLSIGWVMALPPAVKPGGYVAGVVCGSPTRRR